ncbi:Unknown protein sequence [Pseudomonas syringae pv. maculicola]|nr:Unknown protein sequence [Pseudomonas syringae pv. maculicola]
MAAAGVAMSSGLTLAPPRATGSAVLVGSEEAAFSVSLAFFLRL